MRRFIHIAGLFAIAATAAGCLHAVGPRPPLLPTNSGVGTFGVAAGTLPGAGFDEPVFALQYHRALKRRADFPDLAIGASLMNGWAPFSFTADPPRTPLVDLNVFMLAHVVSTSDSVFSLEAGLAPYFFAVPHLIVMGGSPYRTAVGRNRDEGNLRIIDRQGGGLSVMGSLGVSLDTNW